MIHPLTPISTRSYRVYINPTTCTHPQHPPPPKGGNITTSYWVYIDLNRLDHWIEILQKLSLLKLINLRAIVQGVRMIGLYIRTHPSFLAFLLFIWLFPAPYQSIEKINGSCLQLYFSSHDGKCENFCCANLGGHCLCCKSGFAMLIMFVL